MLKNKRIILAVTNDLTHDRRMYRICTALVSAGAEVTLIGRHQKNSVSFSPLGFTGTRLKCKFNKGPLFYAEYNIRLFTHLLNIDFDIACACDLDTALAIRRACSRKKKLSVYDAHEFFTEVPELSGRPAVKNIWELIGRKTIPKFDLRYTVGQELADLMGKKYNVSFHVVRNIAPNPTTKLPTMAVELRKRILLYQGALNVGRGLEASIKAMANLPHWEFWLAGEGDITQQLKDLSKQLGIESRVKFLGWVHPDDLAPLMNQARLGINMRETGSLNDYYSLPNKFFDCIHAGLPSINMNYPEYVNVNSRYPCSILVDEVSPQKIVATINHLDEHPELLPQLSAACKEAAEEFTWEKESRKLIELYDTLLSSSDRPQRR